MKASLLAFILILSPITEEVSAQNRDPVLFVEPGSVTEKVCWHKNARYSLGSIIMVDDIKLQCVRKSRIERDGALKWETYQAERVRRKKH